MAATRQTQADLLRIVYKRQMQVQFNLKSILSQYVARSNVATLAEGQIISLPLHTRQTGGVGWSLNNTLPESGQQGVARHTYNYSHLFGRIEIDGLHAESAHDSAAAERRPYDLETTSLIKQLRHHRNFDLFGDGSGIRCGIVSATATTFVADSIRGLVDGMRVDVLRVADGTVAGGVAKAEITVNRSTLTVSLSEPGTNGTVAKTFADGTGADVNGNPTLYRVYLSGSRNAACFGLEAIVNNANPGSGRNYGNIDRTVAANAFWNANVLANGGVARAITYPLMQEGINEVEIHSDGEVNLIICGHAVWTQLMNDIVVRKRFGGGQRTINGWAQALMMDDIPIVRDKHCPPSWMYLLDTTMFEMHQSGEGSWMNEDGAILSRISGKFAYEAAWHYHSQLVCKAPNAQCVIRDLDTTTPES